MWMVEVNKLSTGGSFGELALLSNQPRLATVKSISDCYFAVLEKEDYGQMLKKHELRLMSQKLEFLGQLPFLNHHTLLQLRRIVHSFTVQNFTINHTVFSQGQSPTHVYIIKEGNFEISRRKQVFDKRENKKKEKENASRRHIGPKSNCNHSAQGNRRFPVGKPSKNEVELRISAAGIGFVIGHNDVISARQHTTTLKCLSAEGSVYVIKCEEFLHKMRKDHRAWVWLNQNSI
jgi:hypothetical protein